VAAAPPAIETDAVVIGAGPVGLFQVFQLGLQEIRAHVVDSLPRPGGQCVELYADKPIYDIPGIPVCTGQELTDRLLKQIAPFSAPLHLGDVVTQLVRGSDGGFEVSTRGGLHFRCRVLVIAAGVGAFAPRALKLAGIEGFEGRQVFHRFDLHAQAAGWAGQDVAVIGGGACAVAAALRLADSARVTLVHRRDDFDAPPAEVAQLRQRLAGGALRFIAGQASGFEEADGRLRALTVLDTDSHEHRIPADAVLVALGLSPKLGPIADWGLALDRKQLVVDTETFQTGERGIFAVGDINTYPGKKKLILCGFHEATLAAFAAAALVHPERAAPLQYTTTSPKLHRLLGV
jgi:thioredoxin reductase (NADPH)